ncbi:hypothetical protein MMC18_002057 [Xylographa bjoerkii]|nr:hypothetical protein [Xylographa bjoerkii]
MAPSSRSLYPLNLVFRNNRRKMYSPQFTYSLSRPYPYKWFSWVVFIGGIAALTLFSVVNFAANGYDLGAQYTTDPNGTEAQTSWTEAPIFSLLNRVGPSCQTQNIPVNTEFYTSKLSLPYTLTNIWRESADGSIAVLPSLAYKNNTLENCSVTLVQIDLESAQRTAMQQGYRHWGAKATASPPLIFASWYWLNLVATTSNINAPDPRLYQATLTFQSTNVSNINRLDFFDVGWHFLLSDGSFILTNGPNFTTAVASNTWPNIWVQADAFAKVFYSAILADLGQVNGSNILSNPALLQNYTDFKNITNNATDVETPWLQAGPARSSYDDLASSLGPLAITPSTIYAQYFCQIPEIKAGGTLFVTILVADLVFLQALWHILKWTTTSWLERHDKQAYYCPGCLETDTKEEIGDMVAARLLDENGEAGWPRYKAMGHSEEEIDPSAPSPVGPI